MRKSLMPLWVLLLLLTVIIAGCMPISPDLEANGTLPPPAQGAEGLPGTGWLLTRYAQDGELGLVPGRVVITATFHEDGTFSTQACNTMSSVYEVDGSSLTIAQGAQTLMLCDGLVGEIEPVYFALLGEVATFEIDFQTLTLFDSDGNALLEFVLGVPSGEAAGDAASAAGGTMPALTDSLDGTFWQVTEYQSDGALVSVADGVVATANFANGTMTGQVCNNYNAPYTVDGNMLTLGPAAMTMMACIGPVGDFETVFHPLLGATAQFEQTADTLTLLDADGNVLLVFAATVPLALEGTTWQLTNLNNGMEAVVNVLDGTVVTATFADGSVGGSGGCNTYGADFTVDGNGISIQAPFSTMMFCGEPEGVSAQEGQFFVALTMAATYSITGDVLEIRDAADALQLRFEAVTE